MPRTHLKELKLQAQKEFLVNFFNAIIALDVFNKKFALRMQPFCNAEAAKLLEFCTLIKIHPNFDKGGFAKEVEPHARYVAFYKYISEAVKGTENEKIFATAMASSLSVCKVSQAIIVRDAFNFMACELAEKVVGKESLFENMFYECLDTGNKVEIQLFDETSNVDQVIIRRLYDMIQKKLLPFALSQTDIDRVSAISYEIPDIGTGALERFARKAIIAPSKFSGPNPEAKFINKEAFGQVHAYLLPFRECLDAAMSTQAGALAKARWSGISG